jgi:uncharacterized spore protein YtfJ
MPNVDEMLEGARDAMSVRRVFGEAYEENGVTVIPVASVRGGGGGGGDSDNNGGGGFGLQARPVGAYVISNGDVRWRPAAPVEAAVDEAVKLVESLVNRILNGNGPDSGAAPSMGLKQ